MASSVYHYFVFNVVNFFLMMSFVLSLLVGSELCCVDSFTQQITMWSISNSESNNISVDQVSKKIHCNHSDQSHGEGTQQSHLCVGCCHSAFINLATNFLKPFDLTDKNIFRDRVQFIPNPFLDKPYQPPRV